jgi:curved DNA-binding protein CbpA
MEPGITWYDVLGVLPGAEVRKIKREYDAKAALLRPELISGASPNVVKALWRAQEILDTAWQVLGDPVSRRRYDKAAAVPDVRGLFYGVCLEVADGTGFTSRPVGSRSTRCRSTGWSSIKIPARRRGRGGALTVRVWHPARPVALIG